MAPRTKILQKRQRQRQRSSKVLRQRPSTTLPSSTASSTSTHQSVVAVSPATTSIPSNVSSLVGPRITDVLPSDASLSPKSPSLLTVVDHDTAYKDDNDDDDDDHHHLGTRRQGRVSSSKTSHRQSSVTSCTSTEQNRINRNSNSNNDDDNDDDCSTDAITTGMDHLTVTLNNQSLEEKESVMTVHHDGQQHGQSQRKRNIYQRHETKSFQSSASEKESNQPDELSQSTSIQASNTIISTQTPAVDILHSDDGSRRSDNNTSSLLLSPPLSTSPSSPSPPMMIVDAGSNNNHHPQDCDCFLRRIPHYGLFLPPSLLPSQQVENNNNDYDDDYDNDNIVHRKNRRNIQGRL